MAYIQATKLPDRYKVVFRDSNGARIRVQLTQAEFDRKDRDAYVLSAYAPVGWKSFTYWFVPFIETFDTPSKELEEGMCWEGVNRDGVARVMWREQGGEFECAKPEDVIISRKGDVPDVIARKSQ